MFKAYATYSTETGSVSGFTAYAYCTDDAEAETVAAKFPKFIKLKIGGLGGVPGKTVCVSFRVSFGADDVNKGKNETGEKRVRKFLDNAEIEWISPAKNSFATLQEFLTKL